jgi:hypothetical protein
MRRRCLVLLVRPSARVGVRRLRLARLAVRMAVRPPCTAAIALVSPGVPTKTPGRRSALCGQGSSCRSVAKATQVRILDPPPAIGEALDQRERRSRGYAVHTAVLRRYPRFPQSTGTYRVRLQRGGCDSAYGCRLAWSWAAAGGLDGRIFAMQQIVLGLDPAPMDSLQ